MLRRRTDLFTVLLSLFIAVVLLATFFATLLTQCAADFIPGGMGDLGGIIGFKKEETGNGEMLARQNSLTMLIDETDFITGRENQAELTVLYSPEILDEIVVTDEAGGEVCRMENDGSGRGTAQISVPSGQDGCIRYQAASGEHQSNLVTCYVHPEVTMEMVRTLAAVSGDLGAFVQEQDFQDPLGAEALSRVKEYLLSDERVADAWENEGAVLYATRDSLMGSYGLGAFERTSFGGSFSDAEETYRAYGQGEDVSGRTLESRAVLTNKSVLHLSPLPEDHLIKFTKEGFLEKEKKLAGAMGGGFSYAEREQAWELLESGAFTDAGFLMLTTHGKRMVRKDGSIQFCFAMGQMNMAEFEEVFDGNRINAGKLWGSYDLDGEYVHSRESYRLIYDYNLLEPDSTHILFATTNYMESILKDRVFDNTIVYFAVCHSAADEQLINLLLDHGAGVYIGSVPTLGASESYATLCALSDVLGSGGTVQEAQLSAMGGKYDDETWKWYNEQVVSGYREMAEAMRKWNPKKKIDDLEEASIWEIREWIKEGQVLYYTRNSMTRTVCGQGELEGSVVDFRNAPVEGAKVTLHRWLDHGYQETATAITDENGHFKVPETDWGLYGITAEKKSGESGTLCRGYGTAEFSRENRTAEPVVLLKGVENNGGNVVGFQDRLYYWKYNGKSFQSPSVFGRFYPDQETANQLICRHEDGSEEVLLNSRGNGPIFITGGRIYLQREDANLFSVKLDGSDRVEHGVFQSWAADEASGTLLGTSYMRGGGVYQLRAEDHQVVEIADEGYHFCGVKDGYCYYTSVRSDNEVSFTLYRISLDGSQVTRLDHVAMRPEDALALDICELSVLDDRVYYSYGFYAGTGGFFQQGGINSVNVDGTSPQVCVPYGDLRAEEFTVEKKDDETFLYYVGRDDVYGSYVGFWEDYPYSGCYMKNLDTGDVKSSGFALSRPGSFVCMDGGIYMLKENSTVYKLVIPQAAAAGFGFLDKPEGTEDVIALVSRLDVVGEQSAFTVDWCQRSREADFGWRPGYVRERSAVYVIGDGEEKAEEWYSY